MGVVVLFAAKTFAQTALIPLNTTITRCLAPLPGPVTGGETPVGQWAARRELLRKTALTTPSTQALLRHDATRY